MPGHGKDYYKQLARLRAPDGTQNTEDECDAKWYYVPEQEPDEVLVVKLMDES